MSDNNPQAIAEALLNNIEHNSGVDFLDQNTLEALAVRLCDELSIRASYAMTTRTIQ